MSRLKALREELHRAFFVLVGSNLQPSDKVFACLTRDTFGLLGLAFSTAGKDPADEFGWHAYELRIIDAAGTTVMRFALPAEIIEPVVFAQTEMLIAMTPDGAITALPADADANFIPRKPVAIDVLVKRAVTPQMLEDEPDAVHVLQTSLNGLSAAVKIVEYAIDNMSK